MLANAERWVAEPAQRQPLELTDPLPCEVELLTDLLERAGDAVVEPVPEGKDPPFPVWKTLDGPAKAIRDIELLGER